MQELREIVKNWKNGPAVGKAEQELGEIEQEKGERRQEWIEERWQKLGKMGGEWQQWYRGGVIKI